MGFSTSLGFSSFGFSSLGFSVVEVSLALAFGVTSLAVVVSLLAVALLLLAVALDASTAAVLFCATAIVEFEVEFELLFTSATVVALLVL